MPIGLTDLTIRVQGKPIVCQKCGQGGGTLRKVDDGYAHVKCPARNWSVTKEELRRLQGK